MAEWQDIDGIYKRQSFNFSGSANRNLSDLFFGTGVENAGVFTLNNGLILATQSCDYWTNWTMSGANINVTSQVETWSNSPVVQFVDLENNRSYPLYMSGVHTPRTINSGYCLYTIELACVGTVTLYENDVPFQVTNSGAIGTPMKIFRRYYNQKANNLVLRVNSTGISWAYVSFAAYYTKQITNVTNTAVVMENVYADSSLGSGVTIPPTVGGGGEGGGGETPPMYPVLGSIGWGNGSSSNIIFDFHSIIDLDTGQIPDIANGEVRNYLPMVPTSASGTHITVPRMSNPTVTVATGRVRWNTNGNNIQYLQFGMKGSPINHTLEISVLSVNAGVRVIQYTTGGTNLGSIITGGSGDIFYYEA